MGREGGSPTLLPHPLGHHHSFHSIPSKKGETYPEIIFAVELSPPVVTKNGLRLQDSFFFPECFVSELIRGVRVLPTWQFVSFLGTLLVTIIKYFRRGQDGAGMLGQMHLMLAILPRSCGYFCVQPDHLIILPTQYDDCHCQVM